MNNTDGFLFDDINVFIPYSMDIDVVAGEKGLTCDEMEKNILNASGKSENIKLAFDKIKPRVQEKDLLWQGVRMGFGSASVCICIERDHKIVDKEEVGWACTI